MATLAPPHLRARWLSGSAPHMHGSDVWFGALLAAGLSLFAVLVHGYHPYAEDGGLYLAGVKHLLHPGLYPQGLAFVLEPTRFSSFAPFVAAVTRATPVPDQVAFPWVVLLLHLGTLWSTLFAAWALAWRIFPGHRSAQAGAVLLLACWLGLPVAGTALLLMDPYLTARSFSTPLSILALVATWDATVLRRGVVPGDTCPSRFWSVALCTAALVVAGLFHPLMAAYACGACLVLAGARAPRRRWALAGGALICATTFGLATVLPMLAQAEPAEYVEVALTRTYWYVGQWRWYEWIGIVAPLGMVAALGFSNDSGERTGGERNGLQRLVAAALFTGLLATTIALLFARPHAGSHLIARMQPMRALQFPYLVMVLLLGAWIGEHVLRNSRRTWFAATVLLSAPLYVAARGTYPASPHLEVPGARCENAWVQAFLWIRTHTPTDALFALSPEYIQSPGEDAQCFRAVAERSALPDSSKDGGEAAIAPGLARDWAVSQAAQRNLDAEDDVARRAALKPLGVTWIVLAAASQTRFECPYTNPVVKVCRLP